MAGIYIHIPFCKQACTYCNFHFSTLLKNKEEILHIMIKEIELQQHFFEKTTLIESIYFGGGTPSLLSIDEINTFINKIHRYFNVAETAEITLEANPDDLSFYYLSKLKDETKINRLSIGVQSFLAEDLNYMHRVHNVKDAKECIRNAQQIGFENLSVDLIYGTPSLTDADWIKNLHYLFDLNIPHISCYALTVEDKTMLSTLIKKKKMVAPDEEKMVRQFSILVEQMKEHNYVQYEISNFCKEPYFAKHNTNYWKGIPYLGIGPSAHSFDGKRRYWNIGNNTLYTTAIKENKLANECEILSIKEQYNEYIMTAIRTMWGIDSFYLETQFGIAAKQYFIKESKIFIDKNWLENMDEIYTLTNDGKIFCDAISSQLFMT